MLPALLLFVALSSPATEKAQLLLTRCDELKPARIEAAVRSLLRAEPVEFTPASSVCHYTSGEIEITISIQLLDAPLNLPAELANLKGAFPDAELTPIPEIEGNAYALAIPGAGLQLHILPSSREYVLISVMGLKDSERARKVAVRLAESFLRTNSSTKH